MHKIEGTMFATEAPLQASPGIVFPARQSVNVGDAIRPTGCPFKSEESCALLALEAKASQDECAPHMPGLFVAPFVFLDCLILLRALNK